MSKRTDIQEYVQQQITRLNAMPDGIRRAKMAAMRNGAAAIPGEIPELWGVFLNGMPFSLMGKNGPSDAEWAIYIALTCYALHRQGNDDREVNKEGRSFGASVRNLAEQLAQGQEWSETVAIHYFNAMCSSVDIREIGYYLRHLIRFIRKPPMGRTITIDYPLLAADLYALECKDPRYPEIPADVRLRWGQDLYRSTVKKDNENKGEND